MSRRQSSDKGPVFVNNIGVCGCMYVYKYVSKAMCIHVLMFVCVYV